MGVCFWSAQLRPITKRLQTGLSQSYCRIAGACVKAANETKEICLLSHSHILQWVKEGLSETRANQQSLRRQTQEEKERPSGANFVSHLCSTDSEVVPPDLLRPRSFTTVRGSTSLRREADTSRLSVSLCDLNLQQDDARLRLPPAPVACPIPQNSMNSQQSSLLPHTLECDLRFHQLRGAHIKTLNEQTVARSEHNREERTLVFTDRPLRIGETIFIKVIKSSPARSGSLSYGVTSCDPAVLRPSDLPYNPEALVDRKEFWAVCRVPTALQSGDILGFLVTQEGEVILSHNGNNVGMQVCVDNSRPLWMFFGLHGAVTQLRILGSTFLGDARDPSTPGSPSASPLSPSGLCGGSPEPGLNERGCSAAFCSSTEGTTPNSPVSLPKSPTFPSASGAWPDECSICYENTVDTVIYACGHMCLCYTCGLRLKKMANASCPICRRAIKDIIKTYRST
ncbi:E3 ubiquitin-protein ligase NEURL1 [Labeo rohita]|uniref:E3 ubiquitin-protein ligase NEURL1 n=1 Tax=Labeo rohita TaxID=84645 RepID=A0ABQ8N073_LABRO|nr:E3 ubiquitin-protein ligase NEURL1 [Labeo rohita]